MQENLWKFLSKPWGEYEKTREQNGNIVTYIPWNKIPHILNDAQEAGLLDSWNYEILRIEYSKARRRKDEELEDILIVTVRLTIEMDNGITIHRDGAGYEYISVVGYGDPVSNATAMALRRAAAMFGIGLYLYDKDDANKPASRPVENRPAQNKPQPQPSDVKQEFDEAEATMPIKDLPLPSDTKFPPSTKQWEYFKKIMIETGHDTVEDLNDLLALLASENKVNPQYTKGWSSMSGRDVSAAIDWLKQGHDGNQS